VHCGETECLDHMGLLADTTYFLGALHGTHQEGVGVVLDHFHLVAGCLQFGFPGLAQVRQWGLPGVAYVRHADVDLSLVHP
jgi:hypothetical protein